MQAEAETVMIMPSHKSEGEAWTTQQLTHSLKPTNKQTNKQTNKRLARTVTVMIMPRHECG